LKTTFKISNMLFLLLYPLQENKHVKKGMVEFTDNPESKQHEIDWQNSEDYPTDLEGLYSVYEEVPFSVIEVGSF
jgi:hypothetical protein